MMHSMILLILSNLCAGIQGPDLVSFDAGSLQAGVGSLISSPQTDMIPDFGLSLGHARLYWGKRLAFAAGMNLFRCDFSGTFATSEILMPEIGAAALLNPANTLRSKACARIFPNEKYIPRIDLMCGFSPLNPILLMVSGNSFRFSPTLRLEGKVLFSRTLYLLFENRYMWLMPAPDGWNAPANSLHLSLVLALGVDIPRPKEKDMPEKH